jgi:hypothetical protein
MLSPESRGHRLASIWSAAALTCIGSAPAVPYLAELVPPCLWRSLTGLPCPLCGTTRAAVALARLDLLHALARYPLPALVWIVFVGGGVAAGLAAFFHRPVALPRRLPRWAGIAAAGAVLANWIYSVATGV